MSRRLRLLLVDDHPVVLSGLSAMFAQHEDLQVVATAQDGAAALACLRETAPDVAVVDLRLPDGDGTQLCRRLLLALPALRVVVLTMHADDEMVLDALSAGASAYVLKDSDPRDIVEAVRLVTRGNLFLSAGARPAVAPSVQPSGASTLAALTPRERSLLEALAQGLNTVTIAERLGVAPKTVRNRLSTIFSKLDVKDRGAAIAVARDAGLGQAHRHRDGGSR